VAEGVEVRESPIHGRGVFATRRFEWGEPILPIDDSRVVTPEAPLDREHGELEHHRDYLGTHDVLMQEPERYINHCCEPSAYIRTREGVRWVVAYCAIAAGEEVTYDYCISSYGDYAWECSCGHARCRRVHNTDFFKLPDEKLREYLPLLDEWFVALYPERVEAARRR
jgi:uncharacterized protein